MRAIFGVISLLTVLLVVGLLAKKQLATMPAMALHMQPLPLAGQAVILPIVSSGTSPQLQSQQIQHQIMQSVTAATQPVRSMPDEK